MILREKERKKRSMKRLEKKRFSDATKIRFHRASSHKIGEISFSDFKIFL